MERVYLDSAATTPVREEVAEEMLKLLTAGGNPSVMYASGRKARKVLEEARERIAECVGARRGEIFFTSGGTESDNWALQGAVPEGGVLVTSMGEHHAVLDVARNMDESVFYLSLDGSGAVRPDELREILEDRTGLVSIMHASNEVGTVNPIALLSQIAKERGAVFHTDAVATVGKLRVRVDELGVDLLSASAHKFYGPPGMGFLYVREGTPLRNLLFGGSQERRDVPERKTYPGRTAWLSL